MIIREENKRDISMIVQGELAFARSKEPDAEYIIELGTILVYELLVQQNIFWFHSDDELTTLFGKPVKINYQDPYVFKLWANNI